MNLYIYFRQIVLDCLEEAARRGAIPAAMETAKVVVEAPRDSAHGDLTTNAAMVLAKPAGQPPRELAALFSELLAADPYIAEVTIAGPGFINFSLEVSFWHNWLDGAFKAGKDFPRSNIGAGRSVNVEYVSANPTGPLHVGHCRGAVFGDALANLLSETGHAIVREYYINDAGEQITVLARSAYLRYREALGEEIGEIPAGLYPGDYLKRVGRVLSDKFGRELLDKPEDDWLDLVRATAIEEMMLMIREDLAALGIHQDLFFSEKSLHDGSEIAETVAGLKKKGLIYQGKLPPPKGKPPPDWEDREQTLFRASDFGDDSDRALVKSSGDFTYFAADVAYAHNKIERGFDELVYVLGADHGGYVKRLQAVAAALSDGRVALIVRLCQLVKLFRGGKPVTMSKRAGEFITLRDVVEEVGPDVVRFMMLYRKNDAPLDFDFEKVTEQSRDNPVFYVQYAHARICSVFRSAAEVFAQTDWGELKIEADTLACLTNDAELALIKRAAAYPKVLEAAALAHEPHRIAFYLYELASDFHSLWNRGKEELELRFVVKESLPHTQARLALLRVIRYALAHGLQIIGVKPVEQM